MQNAEIPQMVKQHQYTREILPDGQICNCIVDLDRIVFLRENTGDDEKKYYTAYVEYDNKRSFIVEEHYIDICNLLIKREMQKNSTLNNITIELERIKQKLR